jgi:hypothetical protein
MSGHMRLSHFSNVVTEMADTSFGLEINNEDSLEYVALTDN